MEVAFADKSKEKWYVRVMVVLAWKVEEGAQLSGT